MTPRSHRLLAFGAWLLALAVAAVLAIGARYTTDLSGFLPQAPTGAQRLLVEQLSRGAASRVLLMAIEGGDARQRSDASAALARALRGDPRFVSVANGMDLEADGVFLFEHRYALSPAVDAQGFTVEGLRDSIAGTIEGLGSSAGLMLAELLPRDPTGETERLALALEAGDGPATDAQGLWQSRDGTASLLVARLAADGADFDAQQSALEAARAAFAPHAADGLDLRLSGPAVFAVAARDGIIREALRVSILGSVLTLGLLLWVYRSARVIVLGLLPVATGALVGVAAVAAGMGTVHAITLGFGVTLIGEAVDYAIYLFVQQGSSGDEARGEWLRQFWPTIRLGMLTSICGFAALVPSGFPGLAQLGLYSVAGLVAAALATRHVLPWLLPQSLRLRDLAPWGERLRATSRALAGSRATRPALAVITLLALAVLIGARDHLWQTELASLSPVPADAVELDARLRAELGAADVRHVVVVPAADLESALRGAEAVGRALDPLVRSGAIGGYESPARLLPSLAAQRARREALPAPAVLRARLAAALDGLPLRAETLEPFVADVARAREAPPLSADALAGTSFGAALDALLIGDAEGVRALLPLRAGGEDLATYRLDIGAVAQAVARAARDDVAAGAELLDLKAQSDALYRGYLGETVRFSLLGFVALLVLLAAVLRSPRRLGRVALPLAVAVACTAAILVGAGRELSLLHVVGMLLIVAIGSNYALFFEGAARGEPGLDSPRTHASVLLACLTSVLGFGVLALSTVPVMRDLGETVAPGNVLALLFAAMLAPRPAPPATGPAGR